MASYTRAKNIEAHEEIVRLFEQNIPSNRKEWKPPAGYDLEFDQYRHSRKGRNHGEYSVRVGARELRDGATWRAVAKCQARWHGTGRNYITFSTILWALESAT